MTFTNTTQKVTVECDGATTSFPFTMPAHQSSDFLVYLINTSVEPNTKTLLTEGSGADYVISISANKTGGTLVTNSTYSSDYEILIYRKLPLQQNTNIPRGSAFPAEDVEEALDRVFMILGQLQEQLDRAVIYALENSTATFEASELYDLLSTTDFSTFEAENIIGLGTAALLDVGTDPNDVVQLDGTGKLPAVDGSQLTGLSANPAGVLLPYAGTAAPSGYLLCYGQEVSRTTYSTLFAAIGVAYGSGNGSTTFNLPDMRGRTAFGIDNLGGTDAGRLSASNTIGTTGGAETHTLTVAELPAHTHGQTLGGNKSVRSGATGTLVSGSVPQTSVTTTENQNITEVAGSGNAHNNMPPYVLMSWIIKT